MTEQVLTHHPDCLYWFEQYPNECTCGLTAIAKPGMHPWPQAAMDEWRRGIFSRKKAATAEPC